MILKDALSEKTFSKQIMWSKENLCYSKHPEKDFADVVENYIKNSIDERYNEFHKCLSNNYYSIYNENMFLKTECEEITEKYNHQLVQLEEYEQKISDYEKGKLYKIAKKLYFIKNKIIRK